MTRAFYDIHRLMTPDVTHEIADFARTRRFRLTGKYEDISEKTHHHWKRLLADIRARRVKVLVIYGIDRLPNPIDK